MNFRLVLMLAAAGVLIGLGIVYAVLPSGVETVAWLVLAVVFALVVARAATGRAFLHGLLAGFLAGAFALVVEIALFSTYLARNPRAAESFQQLPAGVSAPLFVALVGGVISVCYGLVVGGLSALAAKMLRRSTPPA